MATTTHLALTLVDQAQAQKEVTVNAALSRIDAILNTGAIDKDLATPPGSPAEGDVYIVAASPTGAWSGQAGAVAYYNQSWKFIAPNEGMTLWVKDEDIHYSYNGAAWAASVGGGKKSVWIPAMLMKPSATGGCAALATIATSANQPDITSLDFDPATQQYAQFSLAMPKSWNEGTVTARFFWSHAATATNFGVVWSIQGLAISDDDAIAANYGTAVNVTDTGGTTDDQYISAESAAITLAGSPAEGDIAYFRLSRVATDGADTLAINARLHGVMLYYVTNAFTDA